MRVRVPRVCRSAPAEINGVGGEVFADHAEVYAVVLGAGDGGEVVGAGVPGQRGWGGGGVGAVVG